MLLYREMSSVKLRHLCGVLHSTFLVLGLVVGLDVLTRGSCEVCLMGIYY